MYRDDKTGKFVAGEKETVTEDFGYYSKLLKKPFDSIEALKEAEAAFKAEEEKKAAASEKRREEAKVVEEAFRAMNATRKGARKIIDDAKVLSAKKISEANAEYAAAVREQNEQIKVAEERYKKALDEFKAAHPDGYHLTLRDGDTEETITSEYADFVTNFLQSLWDPFKIFGDIK